MLATDPRRRIPGGSSVLTESLKAQDIQLKDTRLQPPALKPTTALSVRCPSRLLVIASRSNAIRMKIMSGTYQMIPCWPYPPLKENKSQETYVFVWAWIKINSNGHGLTRILVDIIVVVIGGVIIWEDMRLIWVLIQNLGKHALVIIMRRAHLWPGQYLSKEDWSKIKITVTLQANTSNPIIMQNCQP